MRPVDRNFLFVDHPSENDLYISISQGDSGGPVMVRQRGRHVQYGVVSFGFSCAAPDMPAVSTKVSAHLDWIIQTIQNWHFDPEVQIL